MPVIKQYRPYNLVTAKNRQVHKHNTLYTVPGPHDDGLEYDLVYKCLPCLLCALEACPVNENQEISLEFTVNKTPMMVFRSTSLDVVTECRLSFGISETKGLIAISKLKFLTHVRQFCAH